MLTKITIGLFGAFGLLATGATARSSLQHPVKGVVPAIGPAKPVLILEPSGDRGPTEFQIVEDWTRLRRDGKPAGLAGLTAGDLVCVYYRREMGQYVATEVTWNSGAQAAKPKVNP